MSAFTPTQFSTSRILKHSSLWKFCSCLPISLLIKYHLNVAEMYKSVATEHLNECVLIFVATWTAKLEDEFLAWLFQAVDSVENLKLGWESDLLTHISGGSRISPRRGLQLPGGGGGRQHTILPKFPKNCMTLKEFGPGGRPSRPP